MEIVDHLVELVQRDRDLGVVSKPVKLTTRGEAVVTMFDGIVVALGHNDQASKDEAVQALAELMCSMH